MRFNKRKIYYIYFVVFKQSLRLQSIYSNNFDYFYFKALVSNFIKNVISVRKFIKFIKLFNLNNRNFVGKTLDWNTTSAINELAFAGFMKKNFIFDSQSCNDSSFINFFFLNKNKLNKFSKDCFFMFIGSALRVEEPLLNLLLRKSSIDNAGIFLNIGSRLSSNFYIKHIGSTIKSFFNFITGNHWSVNLYFKSLYSFFAFGVSFFRSGKNHEVFHEFIQRGFGRRSNDVVFFSGNISTYLTATILGLQTADLAKVTVNSVFNPLRIDFAFNSLACNERFFEKNRVLISFDHSFHSINRVFGDIIVPVRSFLENKKSQFINSFYEIAQNNVSFVRDVEKLFAVSYKRSYDFLVYDSKIINFGFLRASILNSKTDSQTSVAIRACQFSPLLFFSHEHLFNTTDFLMFRKFVLDGTIFMNSIFPRFCCMFLSNNFLFLPLSGQNNITPFTINWFKTYNYFDLNRLSVVTNRVYFDPENDVFSNSSVLLLKTYKRLVIQMSNFN